MVDNDYLEQLRADADEVRADLAERERQLDEDPVAAHDALMQTKPGLRNPGPLVYKTTDQNASRVAFSDQANDGDTNIGNGDVSPFTDDQTDAIAVVMNLLRKEWQDAIAPLLDRVKFLEQALMLSNGNTSSSDNTKLVETEVVRKLCLQQQR